MHWMRCVCLISEEKCGGEKEVPMVDLQLMLRLTPHIPPLGRHPVVSLSLPMDTTLQLNQLAGPGRTSCDRIINYHARAGRQMDCQNAGYLSLLGSQLLYSRRQKEPVSRGSSLAASLCRRGINTQEMLYRFRAGAGCRYSC